MFTHTANVVACEGTNGYSYSRFQVDSFDQYTVWLEIFED